MMRAIGYQQTGTIDRDDALLDIELPMPKAAGRDLLVEVKAVSVNPIDVKVRSGKVGAPPEPGTPKVVGWDAAGVVSAVGPDVTSFKVGDAVFYAGALGRSGTNAQYHLVDERIAGAKPKTLNWAEAAALPLTSVTAWELLFDRLDVKRTVPGAAPVILIIGGAGGVGSIAIQIARACTDLTIIATASRPETQAWVKEMGAHHVIDHAKPLAAQVEALGIGAPSFVISMTETGRHLSEIAALIAPQGRFGLIDDPGTLDINPFKLKSVSVHWELMFTRTLFGTADMAEQGALLGRVSRLIDDGALRSTLTKLYSPINAANLKQVHALIESGSTRGKIVLEGFAAAE
jgi:NADPH2:quinone reductase